MMKTAVIPGSFDPPTVGHLDIIERSAGLFDRVVVGVLVNKDKRPVFSEEERVELMELSVSHLPNVSVRSFSGLLRELVREVGACAVVKGVRGVADYEYELTMAEYNRRLWGDSVQTILLPCRPELAHLSSSGVKQLAGFGGEFLHYLPASIADRVAGRLAAGGRE